MSLEQVLIDHAKELAANTAAVTKHNELIEKMMSAAKPIVSDASKDTPRRTRTADKETSKDEKREPAGSSTVETRQERPAGTAATGKEETLFDIGKAFLDYGDESTEAEDERDRRKDFLGDVLDFLKAKKLSEVDPKHTKKIKRWFKIYENGDKVDFEND